MAALEERLSATGTASDSRQDWDGRTALLSKLSGELGDLRARQALIDPFVGRQFEQRFLEVLIRHAVPPSIPLTRCSALLARRSSQLIVLVAAADDPALGQFSGEDPDALLRQVLSGTLTEAILITPTSFKLTPAPIHASECLDIIRENPAGALNWFARMRPQRPPPVETFTPGHAATPFRVSRPGPALDNLVRDLGRLDFYAIGARAGPRPPRPFDAPDRLAPRVAAAPKRRSVLFSHHCYYNFFYLARALRARGWDAVALSTEPPDGPHANLYHGEDLTVFDPDPARHDRLVEEFFTRTLDRFGIVHSYGLGRLSVFDANNDVSSDFRAIPWDILERKRRGVLIGYSHCGCLDGVRQSTFECWSPMTCGNCVWRDQPAVCSNERNLTWGRKLTTIVDLLCTETDPPLDFKGSPKAFRAPLTFALDPEIWRTDLEPPGHLIRPRSRDEVLVYHGMANFELGSREGRNVKGTGAIVAAVEQLQREGLNIRLDFVKDVPSKDNRFVQSQADIIVDQLNYGRYGALGREGMMLGKPVVGRVNKDDGDGRPATQCILETPIVDADERSIVDVLRRLASDPQGRKEIGEASRAHALKWWSADRLAQRFEYVYDRLRDHGRAPPEEEVP
jgi:glycosyltransferase involved in cell wall biosynthesis